MDSNSAIMPPHSAHRGLRCSHMGTSGWPSCRCWPRSAVGVQLGVATGQPHGVAVRATPCLAGARRTPRARPVCSRRCRVGGVGKAKRGIAPHGHGAAREQAMAQAIFEAGAGKSTAQRCISCSGIWPSGVAARASAAASRRWASCRPARARPPGPDGARAASAAPALPAASRLSAMAAPASAPPSSRPLSCKPSRSISRMPLAAHAVGQHAGPGHVCAVMLQAKGQRAKRARHGRCIDHRQHGHRQSAGPDRPRWGCRRTGPSRPR